MEIIVKRVMRDFKAEEIWRVEIISPLKNENCFFKTAHSANELLGDAIEKHEKFLKRKE